MKTTIMRRIGHRQYKFEFEGTNFVDTGIAAQQISFGDVLNCGIYESNNLLLQFRKANNHDIAFVYCQDCASQLDFSSKDLANNIKQFYLSKTTCWRAKADWVRKK